MCNLQKKQELPRNNPENEPVDWRRDLKAKSDIGAKRAQVVGSRRQLPNLCIFFLLSGCFAFFGQRAFAQGIDRSELEGLGRPSQLHGPSQPNQSYGSHQLDGADNLHVPNRHFSSTGKPCIALESYVAPEATNRRIFEHWVKASNRCGQNIKVQVCYHKTVDCIVIRVPPWESKSAVLGIQPNMKEFQYDAKED